MSPPRRHPVPADTRMATHLTTPFARGADRLELAFQGGATPARARFAPYAFTEHTAAFGTDPLPRYVVRALAPTAGRRILTVGYGIDATSRVAHVSLRDDVLPGASFLVPLPEDARADARLTDLTVDPPLSGSTVAQAWTVTALLGDLAALCWVLGAEHDVLAAHARRLRGIRAVGRASGTTLDRIGGDLGVPRFPPLPHGDDPGTIALYHLDEPPGSDRVADAAALYGGTGHHGTVVGALLGVPGRFGTAAGFTDPPAEVRVAHHPELSLPAGASLTVECLVRPDSGAWEGVVLSKHADPSSPAKAGWALSVGGFGRGIDRNVRFLAADGTRQVVVFADLSLATGRFQHLAGVVDRDARQARLYVDGVLSGVAPLGDLGSLTTTASLRIGRSEPSPSAAWHGSVDEARISSRARASFPPVLGESDASYRRRLTVFRRWTLPTPEGLQAAVNTAAGPVLGIAEPFTVEDADPVAAGGSLPVTVTVEHVPAGGSVDALGRRGRPESEASGSVADDRLFDTTVLVTVPASPRLSFADSPGAPPRMRVGTRRALLALLDRLAAEGADGPLRLRSGHDPAAGDLRAVGRALTLDHENVPLGRLAALAQQAGFSWVRNLGHVYASVASTDAYDILISPRTPAVDRRHGADLLVPEDAEVALDPPPYPGAIVRWSTVRTGEGRGSFLDVSGRSVDGPWTGPSAALRAERPGRLLLQADVRIGTRTCSVARPVQIGVASLAAGRSIAADGALDTPEPDLTALSVPGVAPSRLVTMDDPGLTATDVASRRVHPALAEALSAWLAALASEGATGRPRSASGWRPDGSGMETVGRAATIERGTCSLALDRMGALAHAVGLGHVAHTGTALRITHATGDPVLVEGTTLVPEDGAAGFRVGPRALPCAAAPAGTRLVVANPGTDTVSVLGPDGVVERAVKSGWRPVDIAVSPDATTAYSADRSGMTLTVVSLDPGAESSRATVSLPAEPVALAHSPTAPLVVVALSDRLALAEDTAVVGSVPLPARPVALALSSDGATAWLALADATLLGVSVPGLALSAPVGLPGAPAGLAIKEGRVYVTVPGSRALCVHDPATGAMTTVTGVGTTPTAVVGDPSGPGLCIADPSAGHVLRRTADGSAPPTGAWVSCVGTPVALASGAGRVYVVTRADDTRGGIDAVGVLDAAAPHAGIAAYWPLGTGAGERLRWTSRPLAEAAARLDASGTPAVLLRPSRPGPLLLTADLHNADHAPFRLRIGLHPRLREAEAAGTPVVVRKDQYDLVMNVLNELHPIGVEIDTRMLRAHVVELRAGLLDVFPAYTYPTYRQRVRPPGRTSQESE